ncbi:metallophosphoesterase family protein [Desulfotomaculum sp. 1211_IL3151]|uniref:metallophosphoesterase family protein n=1 Tax=Desulfotomaculum sp. 1211_IL3151 TaxID=3084055 RepID=UPI002FDB1EDD
MKIKINRHVLIIAIAIFLSLLAVHIFGSHSFDFEGLEFNVRTTLAYQGTTQLEVPPLGLVRAYTHSTPLKMTVHLTGLDLEKIQSLVQNNVDQREISLRLENDLKKEARRYVGKLIALAGVAGLLGAFLLRSRKITEYLLGSLVAVGIVGLLLFATYKSFDVNRFSNPEYEGALKAAPWMIGIAEEAITKIDTLSNKLQLVAENFYQLYEQVDNLQPLATDTNTTKILHVSDLHNNPAGIEVVRRMAELFQVDFIIDTGDISDFGTPLEGLLLERIKSLPVPYLFLAGNHDSPSIISKMKELKGNVMVLGKPVEIKGFRIVGFHDPASRTNQIKSVAPEEEEQFVKQIKYSLAKQDKPVDIIAVHSPYVARPLAGLAPVLLFGHNHQFNVEKVGHSVLINAGTSGASGLGALQEVEKRPYSVMLLNYYHDGKENRLIAVDSIQIDSVTSEFSMKRHLFDGSTDATEKPLDSDAARDIRSRLEENN